MNIVRANRAPPRGGAALRGLRSVLPRDAAQAPLRVARTALILFFLNPYHYQVLMNLKMHPIGNFLNLWKRQ